MPIRTRQIAKFRSIYFGPKQEEVAVYVDPSFEPESFDSMYVVKLWLEFAIQEWQSSYSGGAIHTFVCSDLI